MNKWITLKLIREYFFIIFNVCKKNSKIILKFLNKNKNQFSLNFLSFNPSSQYHRIIDLLSPSWNMKNKKLIEKLQKSSRESVTIRIVKHTVPYPFIPYRIATARLWVPIQGGSIYPFLIILSILQFFLIEEELSKAIFIFYLSSR